MTKKQHCIRCSRKDPCVTVYHGTSVNSVSSIRRDGMTNQFVTTNAYTAHWFGKDWGRPILLKVRTPISRLRWTDQDHTEEHKVALRDLKREEQTRDTEDLYLFIKGTIKPCQITIVPRSKMIRRVTKKSGLLGFRDFDPGEL